MRLTSLSVEGGYYADADMCGNATFYCDAEEVRALRNNQLQDPSIYRYEISNTKILAKTTSQGNKDIKVIFNDPATILFMNGKKYVSKAHEEDFDEEKGLLMCIAKANGISHLELKRMIKNAKRPDKK